MFTWLYDPVLYIFIHIIRKKVADIVNNYQPNSVIDICCGTGNQLKYLKKQGFNNVIGIDLSQSMIHQANKGDKKIHCEEQDAAKLHFHNNSFDFGIISLALHEKPFETAREIIAEAKRVINPDGHLLVVDYNFTGNVKFLSKVMIYAIERFAGKSHYKYFKNYLEMGGMDELLKNHQLKEEYIFHGGGTSIKVYEISKFDYYV